MRVWYWYVHVEYKNLWKLWHNLIYIKGFSFIKLVILRLGVSGLQINTTVTTQFTLVKHHDLKDKINTDVYVKVQKNETNKASAKFLICFVTANSHQHACDLPKKHIIINSNEYDNKKI